MGMSPSSYTITLLMLIPRYLGHEALDVGHLTHSNMKLAPDRVGVKFNAKSRLQGGM
jgi:hypothetical protein